MKTLFFYCFCITLLRSTFVHSQTTDYIRLHDDWDMRHMIRTSDGNVAALAMHFQMPVVIKMDTAGNIIWKTKVQFASPAISFSITETSDLGIVCLTSDPSAVILFKLDLNGNYLWIRRYDAPGTQGHDLAPNDVGGVIVVAGGCLGHNVLIYTDSFGNVSWAKSYRDNNYSATNADNIIKVSNTEYIVAGSLITFATTSGKFLMSVSNTGSLNWFREYNFSFPATCYFKKLKRLSGGGFLLAAFLQTGIGSSHIIVTDNKGLITWSKDYAFSVPSEPSDVVELQDASGYVMGGIMTYPGVSHLQVMLMKVGLNGVFQWARTDGNLAYQGQGVDVLTSLLSLSGNRYLGVGFADGGCLWRFADSIVFCHPKAEVPTVTNSSISLVNPVITPINITFSVTAPTAQSFTPATTWTLACTRNGGGTLVGLIDQERSDELSLFPNPSAKILSINMGKSHTGNLTVEIYDLLGRSVYKTIFFNESLNTPELHLSHNLQDGQYLMYIKTANKTYRKPFLIENQ